MGVPHQFKIFMMGGVSSKFTMGVPPTIPPCAHLWLLLLLLLKLQILSKLMINPRLL